MHIYDPITICRKRVDVAASGMVNVLCTVVFIFNFLHFNIAFGKFVLPYLGKATAAARAALPMQSNKCMLGLFMLPQSTKL